ncbi:MAG: adenosine kinase [Actinomycetota bacterium]|nr:adenosine kinase [Actinomycetota bacterium]
MAIIGVGHAIVDLFVEAERSFLEALSLEPGTMVLVETAETARILEHLSVVKATSGGSAANTLVGVASLGHEATFIGTLGRDAFGETYASDLAAAGVKFDPVHYGDDGERTGHCVVVVTPGGQRTMLTHLGASTGVARAMETLLDEPTNGIVYFEGYVLDSPGADSVINRMLADPTPGRRIAFSLSDRNLVERRKAEIYQMLHSGGVGMVLGNEGEACELTGAADAASAVDRLAELVPEGAVTLGAEGALVYRGSERAEVPALSTEVVDTTGAGDLFAAGYLAAAEGGLGLYASGELGCLCSAEVISHFGARPAVRLAELAGGLLG